MVFSPRANPVTRPRNVPGDVGKNCPVTSPPFSVTAIVPLSVPAGGTTSIRTSSPLIKSARFDTTLMTDPPPSGPLAGELSLLSPQPSSATSADKRVIVAKESTAFMRELLYGAIDGNGGTYHASRPTEDGIGGVSYAVTRYVSRKAKPLRRRSRAHLAHTSVACLYLQHASIFR